MNHVKMLNIKSYTFWKIVQRWFVILIRSTYITVPPFLSASGGHLYTDGAAICTEQTHLSTGFQRLGPFHEWQETTFQMWLKQHTLIIQFLTITSLQIFCTYLDSCAVAACAKTCSKHIITSQIRAKLGITAEKFVGEMGLSVDKCLLTSAPLYMAT